MIKEVKGDLLELASVGHFDIIIHGCNCQCMMGAGIAAQIAKTFPKAYDVDIRSGKGFRKLGDFTVAQIKTKQSSFKIVNAYTQVYPGSDFRLFALETVLAKINILYGPKESKYSNIVKIGLPKIGAGIGGGNWEDIYNVIKKQLDPYFDVTIVNTFISYYLC